MAGTLLITEPHWLAKGTKLFGPDIKTWRFKCPRCKHVQTINDFLAIGITKEIVNTQIAFSCIGRQANSKSGCDWTLGGLLQIHTLELIRTNGSIRPIFEFEEPEVQ